MPVELDDDVNDVQIDPTEADPVFEAAMFILKTRDGRKLTQTVTDGIVHDTKIFVERTVDMLEKVMKRLEAMESLRSEELSDIHSVSSNPFEGLESQYRQEKFFQENFNYVVNVLIHLLHVYIHVCACRTIIHDRP